jgi:hypothetical protein
MCFSHGQLYVAASRVGLPSHLRFAVAPNSEGEFWTATVVYYVFTIYQIEIQRRGLLAQIVVRHSRSIVLPPVDECNVEFITGSLPV